MKTTIFLVLLLISITSPRALALFGHTAEERQRRISAEQQLSQEHQKLSEQEQRVTDEQHHVIEQQRLTSRWQTTSSVLGIVAVLTLIAGTAIGSKGRHHAARGK